MPLFAIISYEMRSTYWKLSAFSTNVRTSKSGGIGSKEALGRTAGIALSTGYPPRSRALGVGLVAGTGNTSAASSYLQTKDIGTYKLGRVVAVTQGASAAKNGSRNCLGSEVGYRNVDATEGTMF
jgi:hypothetical protein